MPAREPVLGSSVGDRRLVGNNLQDSDVSTGHARHANPPTGWRRSRSGIALRAPPPRRPAPATSESGQGVTYVPTHERPITCDISRDAGHHQPLRKELSADLAFFGSG